METAALLDRRAELTVKDSGEAKWKNQAPMDDADFMGSLWQDVFAPEPKKRVAIAADEEKDLKKKRARPSGSDKDQHDLNVSSEVVMKASHILSDIRRGDPSVTTAKLNAMLLALDNRMNPRLLELYSKAEEGVDGVSSSSAAAATDGMLMLEKLRSYKDRLTALLPLVQEIDPKTKSDDSAKVFGIIADLVNSGSTVDTALVIRSMISVASDRLDCLVGTPAAGGAKAKVAKKKGRALTI